MVDDKKKTPPKEGTPTGGSTPPKPSQMMCDFHPGVPAMPGKRWCKACYEQYLGRNK